PSRMDVSNIPGLLLPGASDVLLLTDEEGDAFCKNDSFISILLLVGQVTVTVSYSLTKQQDPHLWYPQFEINNKKSSFTGDRTLKAGTYQNFSMYTLPIDTKSGGLDLTFMDLAPS
ncbi:MAG TPA: hypothetical protein VK034_09695, partial [Enhygromyxa sp.]|nr:hypothetical protein [Enhygromyxa sp.]